MKIDTIVKSMLALACMVAGLWIVQSYAAETGEKNPYADPGPYHAGELSHAAAAQEQQVAPSAGPEARPAGARVVQRSPQDELSRVIRLNKLDELKAAFERWVQELARKAGIPERSQGVPTMQQLRQLLTFFKQDVQNWLARQKFGANEAFRQVNKEVQNTIEEIEHELRETAAARTRELESQSSELHQL